MGYVPQFRDAIVFITHLSNNFITLETLSLQSLFRKEFATLLSAMSERQDSTLIECLKSTGSIYRIFKSQKLISLLKASQKKEFSLIVLSFCDNVTNVIKSYSTRHFPYSLTYRYYYRQKHLYPQNCFQNLHIRNLIISENKA